MTWREKVVVQILLLVARVLADDAVLADEIRKISNHVTVNAPRAE